MKKEARIYILTSILLCGIALHYMLISIMLRDSNIVKFWKEIVIMLMMADTLLPTLWLKEKNKFNVDYETLAFCIFIICLIGSGLIITNNLMNAIFVIRLYLIPIIIYYIAKNNKNFTKQVVSKIVKLIFIFYSIISLWGIFQAFVLGDKFLIRLGYPLKYAGRLRDSYYLGGFENFQRIVSTFANTNVFAATIGVVVIIVIFNPELVETIKNKKHYLLILMVAFILTFSRSNWLAMIVIIVISNSLNINKIKNIVPSLNKKTFKKIAISLVILILVIFGYAQITGVNIFEILQKYIINTITMKDTSASGRTGIWKTGFITFINNPFGIGLGNVGMVAYKLSGKIKIVGESSYLALLLDTGIQGTLSYFTALFFNFYYAVKCKCNSNYANNYLQTMKYLIIYLMIIFIFSNHIYDLEIMIIMFFFIGLSRNKNFLN